MTEPRGARRAAVMGARAAGATIGVGVAVLAIAVAVFAPLPTHAVHPPTVQVTPVATPQQLVCPGSVLRLGDAQGKVASSVTALGTSNLVTGATSGQAVATPFGKDAGTPTLLSAPTPGTAVTVSGSQSQTVATPDVSGFAAANCPSVSTDSWLVGGSTTTGRTTLVTLANPTDVPSTVALDIYGEKGTVAAAGTTGIQVDPGSQRVLSLAGFAPDTASPVVHVTSTGGHIVANLQQSIVRGLDPSGIDIVGATMNPALSVVVPGLVVVSPADIENRIAANADNADLGTVVRLFVPGSSAAKATVTVLPEGKASKGSSFDVNLDARVVTDVPVDGLEAGSYSVTVTSTEPVVGAVRVSAVSGPDGGANTSDFAWLASPTPVRQGTSFTVAAGPAPTLHVTNPSATAADVTVTPAGGTAQRVSVAAGASVSLPVTSGVVYGFSASGAVRAAVGFSSTTALAGMTVDPPLADAEPITVYP